MSDCIETTWSRTGGGYGQSPTFINGKRQKSHRWAWKQQVGPIPDGMWVLHHCDNPACINIDHLYLGTAADNARDREARGRSGYARGKLTVSHPQIICRKGLHIKLGPNRMSDGRCLECRHVSDRSRRRSYCDCGNLKQIRSRLCRPCYEASR